MRRSNGNVSSEQHEKMGLLSDKKEDGNRASQNGSQRTSASFAKSYDGGLTPRDSSGANFRTSFRTSFNAGSEQEENSDSDDNEEMPELLSSDGESAPNTAPRSTKEKDLPVGQKGTNGKEEEDLPVGQKGKDEENDSKNKPTHGHSAPRHPRAADLDEHLGRKTTSGYKSVPFGVRLAVTAAAFMALSELLYFAFVQQSNDKATNELNRETLIELSSYYIVAMVLGAEFLNKWVGSLSNLILDMIAIDVFGDADALYKIVVNLFKPKTLKESIDVIHMLIALPSFLALAGADPIAFARIVAEWDVLPLLKIILIWLVAIITLLLGAGYYAAFTVKKFDATSTAAVSLGKEILENPKETLGSLFQLKKIPALLESGFRVSANAIVRGVLADQSTRYLGNTLLGMSKSDPYLDSAAWSIFFLTMYVTYVSRSLPTLVEYLNREYDGLKLNWRDVSKTELVFDTMVSLVRGVGVAKLMDSYLPVENEDARLFTSIAIGTFLMTLCFGTSYRKNMQKTALALKNPGKVEQIKPIADMSAEEAYGKLQTELSSKPLIKSLLQFLNFWAGETRFWSFPLFLLSVFPEMDFLDRLAFAAVVGLVVYIADRQSYASGIDEVVGNYFARAEIVRQTGFSWHLLTAPARFFDEDAIKTTLAAVKEAKEEEKRGIFGGPVTMNYGTNSSSNNNNGSSNGVKGRALSLSVPSDA